MAVEKIPSARPSSIRPRQAATVDTRSVAHHPASHSGILGMQASAGNAATAAYVQRFALAPLPTPASKAGWKLFGKTTWGDMLGWVSKFNALRGDSSADIEQQLRALDQVEQFASYWEQRHATDAKAAQKKAEVATLKASIPAEREALNKKLATARVTDKVASQDASDRASATYMPQFAQGPFIERETGWKLWLDTPELAPIFRNYIVFDAYSPEVITARDAILAWNGSAADAKRIYNQFSMKDTTQLNLGEKVSKETLNRWRREVEAIDDNGAPPRADLFEIILTEFREALQDLFKSNGRGFVSTPAFQRVTQPPAAQAAGGGSAGPAVGPRQR